jgi:hypothetical protein
LDGVPGDDGGDYGENSEETADALDIDEEEEDNEDGKIKKLLGESERIEEDCLGHVFFVDHLLGVADPCRLTLRL